MYYIIDPNPLTVDQYEAEFDTILVECESRRTAEQLLEEEQKAYFDTDYPASYYEAERIFHMKFGISHDDAMNGGKRDSLLQQEMF